VSPFPTETLEIDAQSREGLVLDVALPVLGAWATSVRVLGFRPSMGVSGLSPREVARLRTLGLATASKATGVFEGANDFRLGFPHEMGVSIAPPTFGVEADLGGHPLAPVVADLTIASFGLPVGKSLTHRLRGFTHLRAASAQGYGSRTLEALGREFGLDLEVTTEELGFEPQGLGSVSIAACRRSAAGASVNWKERGGLRAIHAVMGGVRPKQEQMDRLEAELREALWEARRIEPKVQRVITPGVDLGAFLQIDVECERGGATFMDIVGRSAAPLPMARRAVKRAFGFWDSSASCDETTGITALSAAVAARGEFELALVPSERLSAALALLRDIGARIEEDEAPGLVMLRTCPQRR
jgi:RNA 3'-terminal phosphate cyclase